MTRSEKVPNAGLGEASASRKLPVIRCVWGPCGYVENWGEGRASLGELRRKFG